MEYRNILDKILNDFNKAILDINRISKQSLNLESLSNKNLNAQNLSSESLSEENLNSESLNTSLNGQTEITVESLEKEKQIAIQNLDILKIKNLEEQIKNFNN